MIVLLVFSNIIILSNSKEINESRYYGFIIPLPQGLDTTQETFENSRVRHLVNDLLRFNISVYWTKNDFLALSKKLNSDELESNHSFKQGAFIAPFSGNLSQDILLTSIINNYNQTHELENQSKIQNKIYLLSENLEIIADKLTETKIAQHFGKAVRYSWPSYLEIADAGGFLTYEYFFDDETIDNLNNKDYNVYIWPYKPDPASFTDQVSSLTNLKLIESIRSFVNNGGGYIGTCYGTYAASSGFFIPSWILSLRKAYNPNSTKFFPTPSLSISDSFIVIYPDAIINSHIVEIKTTNPDHPVFFGVNETLDDFLKSPLFFWLGKNTQTIAVFSDVKLATSRPDGEVKELTKKVIIGRPAYVTSTFGKGKMVLYDSHPDFVNNITPLFHNRQEWDGDRFYGRRIVHNSIFYVTSEENKIIEFLHYYNYSFIERIINFTDNLEIQNNSSNDFNEISRKIDLLSENVTFYENMLKNLRTNFESSESSRFFNYGIWYCYLFQDFFNRSIENIEKIERINLMLSNINISIDEKISSTKTDFLDRINDSQDLLSEVIDKVESLKNSSWPNNILLKIRFLLSRKPIFLKFSECLRNIPQMYFETLKLLRYLWYNYEKNIALSNL